MIGPLLRSIQIEGLFKITRSHNENKNCNYLVNSKIPTSLP